MQTSQCGLTGIGPTGIGPIGISPTRITGIGRESSSADASPDCTHLRQADPDDPHIQVRTEFSEARARLQRMSARGKAHIRTLFSIAHTRTALRMHVRTDARCGRVLCAVRYTTGMRKVLVTMISSIPSISNVGVLLALLVVRRKTPLCWTSPPPARRRSVLCWDGAKAAIGREHRPCANRPLCEVLQTLSTLEARSRR